ncbi:MAG: nucleoside diphosphate kinase [Phycisphaerae bacterium]
MQSERYFLTSKETDNHVDRTLIILKPDCVQRRLIGRVLQRFEDKGLSVIGLKLMRISRDLAEKHYAVHKGKPFYPPLIDYITSGPVVVLALEGPRCIEIARTLMGKTFGYEAAPGTIRGDFGASRSFNLIHGSDAPESAAFELGLYFTPQELCGGATAGAEWVFPKNDV